MLGAEKAEKSSRSGRSKLKPGEVLWTDRSERVRSAVAERLPSSPIMPVESIGECKQSKSCKQFLTYLADGLCVDHWDRHVSYRDNIGQN